MQCNVLPFTRAHCTQPQPHALFSATRNICVRCRASPNEDVEAYPIRRRVQFELHGGPCAVQQLLPKRREEHASAPSGELRDAVETPCAEASPPHFHDPWSFGNGIEFSILLPMGPSLEFRVDPLSSSHVRVKCDTTAMCSAPQTPDTSPVVPFMVPVKVKCLSDFAILPVRATDGSVGLEPCAAHAVKIPPHTRTILPLDIAV